MDGWMDGWMDEKMGWKVGSWWKYLETEGFWSQPRRPSRQKLSRRSSTPHAAPPPGSKPEVEVTLLPPSLEDLYLNQNSSVTCVVTNLKSYQDVRFSWSRDDGAAALEVTPGAPEKLANGLYRLTSSLKVCADEWNSGEKFSVAVTVPELGEPIRESVKKDLGRHRPMAAREVTGSPSTTRSLG